MDKPAFVLLDLRLDGYAVSLAAVRTLAGFTSSFEVEIGVRQRALAGPFLINFANDDIMERAVEQCLADVVAASSARPLVDIKYTGSGVIFVQAARSCNMSSTLYRN
ncbi:hypothetical protein RB195_006223 [Necator americanus]|uniref:Uncharacterized protein n=1 Tax=Necator americanus TaxID=51031 RepID=A0ABR1BT21_NECAM